ncbi:MAG: EF-hand domain-containing protein [Vicinamibacterales bacterium]
MRIAGTATDGVDATARQQQFFEKADADGNGGISKDELKTMLEQRPRADEGRGPSLDDLFSRIDADGDGEISSAENDTFMQQMDAQRPRGPQGPPNPAQLAKMVFETADADGSGSLTRSELLDAFSNEKGNSDLASLFDAADTDGDGIDLDVRSAGHARTDAAGPIDLRERRWLSRRQGFAVVGGRLNEDCHRALTNLYRRPATRLVR